MWRTAAWVAGFALTAALTRWVRLEAFAKHQAGQRYEDTYYLPPPQWLPILSLGYEAALADLVWCRSLVYFGEELSQRGSAKNVYQYTDAVLALDPSFKGAYRWAATNSIYRNTDIQLSDAERGADYLRRAVKRWPDDGELRWALGSFLRFELAPLIKNDRPQKERIYAESSPHLRVAALKGAGPAWLSLNNPALLAELGHKEQAIRQLEEVYATIDDEKTRTEIARQLTRLRSETYTAALRATVDQYVREHRANFPYLDSDLYFLVGPKVAPGYPDQVAHSFEPAGSAEALDAIPFR